MYGTIIVVLLHWVFYLFFICYDVQWCTQMGSIQNLRKIIMSRIKQLKSLVVKLMWCTHIHTHIHTHYTHTHTHTHIHTLFQPLSMQNGKKQVIVEMFYAGWHYNLWLSFHSIQLCTSINVNVVLHWCNLFHHYHHCHHQQYDLFPCLKVLGVILQPFC